MSDHETSVVRSPVAPLLAEPRIASEQISQRLAGHRVVVEQRRDAWRRVRGADGYSGWTHEGYLRPLRREDDVALRTSLGCMVRDGSGSRRHLPLGARLDPEETIESGTALEPEALARRFLREPRAIAASATRLFPGTAYVWGGITPWGADCSGFVQSCFALHGVALPRDARDQATCGEAIEDELAAAAPADLLFFAERTDGRVTHVGVAIGDGRMAHVALGRGGFAIDELRAADPYVVSLCSRFVGARRVVRG